jgi:transposase
MTMRALRSTARRIQVLQAEADELYAQLQRLTAPIAPWLLELFGVGPSAPWARLVLPWVHGAGRKEMR